MAALAPSPPLPLPSAPPRLLAEARALLVLAAPMTLALLFQYLLGFATVVAVGHLGPLPLAAGALGFMWANVTGFSLLSGTLTALDSLVAQAHGREAHRVVLVLLLRAILVCSALLVPIAVLWWYVDSLLLLLGQEPALAALTASFTRHLLPALPPAMVLECFKRWLQAQGIVVPVLAATVAATVLGATLSWLLVHAAGLGLAGAPLALALTYTGFAVTLGIYMLSQRRVLLPLATAPRLAEAVAEAMRIDGLATFLSLAGAGVAMTCAEWWAFELLAVLAGWLGTVALDTHTVLINTSAMCFMVTLGLALAASTRVGVLLGAGEPEAAALTLRIVLSVAVPLAVIFATLLFAIRGAYGRLFSEDAHVQAHVARALPYMCAGVLGDAVQGVASGILRGMARQGLGAVVNLAAFYALALPVSYVLAFYFAMDVAGLWLGLIAGSWTQALVYSLILARTDWRRESHLARKRHDSAEQHMQLLAVDDAIELL